MAYGVKFRLDFDDMLGNGKRLEILEDNYSGDVKALIGASNPVIIKWEADDDIYSPIIGSTCTINLFKTDTTEYDDFHTKAEKNYKVIISASETVNDIYQERVQTAGGYYEVKTCIDNEITKFYTISSYYNKRVLDLGGIVESLGCITSQITDSRRNIYKPIWTGWLVPDLNAEVMAPNPQPITLKAIDGLAQLEAANPSTSTGNRYIDHFVDGLNTIGLELDVLVNNDLQSGQLNIFGNDFFYPIEQTVAGNSATTFLEQDIFDENYNFFNYKEFIEALLQSINARIYQSNNKWTIANNSTYSEIRVQDDVQNTLIAGGTLPTDIKQRRKNFLDSKTEFTRFRFYDHSATPPSTSAGYNAYPNTYVSQTLSNIKTDVTPLEQTLTREFQRGFKSIETEVKTKRVISTSFNSSFEYTPVSHNIINGSVVSNQIRKTGEKSFKITQTSSSQTSAGNQQIITPTRNQNGGEQRTAKFSYYFDAQEASQTSTSNGKFWYRITATGTTGGTRYYNSTNDNWQNSAVTNYIEINTATLDAWVDQSITLPADTATNFNVPGVNTKISIFAPSIPTNYNNYQALYIDNISVSQEASVSGNPNVGNVTNSLSLTLNSTTNTIVEKRDILFLPTTSIFAIDYTRFTTAIFGPAPNFVFQVPFARQIVLQQQLNDNRETSVRYEGTIYNNNTRPLDLTSKIWVNFGQNIFQEERSCILDSLEYDVKANRYNVIMHTPNQDNDVATTFRTVQDKVTKI